jgi:hypothetical protein
MDAALGEEQEFWEPGNAAEESRHTVGGFFFVERRILAVPGLIIGK